jgi:hypothetical protein
MTGRRSPDVPGLVGAVAIVGLGILLVLDSDGRVDLGFAYAGPALLGALGIVLLVSGVWSRRTRS